jgi:hypothetical protein
MFRCETRCPRHHSSNFAVETRSRTTYSLLGSAKLNGIDPEIYLHHVIERIADHPISRIDQLLSWNVSLTPVQTTNTK